MKCAFKYILFICTLIFLITVHGEAKRSNKHKELLQKALVVLQQITAGGSIESKAKTAGMWALLKTDSSIEKLRGLIREKHHVIVAQSALALHRLGDNTGKQVLEQIITEELHIDKHANQIVQFKLFSQYKFRKISAAKALGKIGDAKSFRLIKTLRAETSDGQIRDGCSIALAILGDPAERVIFENAVSIEKTKDAELRKTAVVALGTIRNTASIGVLKKSLLDPDPNVRAQAARSLSLIGVHETSVYLRDRVNDDDIGARREVIRALGKLLDPENIPLIEDALDSNDGVLRVIASGSLGPYGYAKGFSYLEIALKDKDRDARLEAVASLAQIMDKKVFKFLEPMLKDKDDMVRITAAEALIRKIIIKKD